MKRRIFAWILLAGFVLLILNLLVIRLYWKESMVIYLIIVFAFMLTNGNMVNFGNRNQDKFYGMGPYFPDEDGEGAEGNDEIETTDGADEIGEIEGSGSDEIKDTDSDIDNDTSGPAEGSKKANNASSHVNDKTKAKQKKESNKKSKASKSGGKQRK